MTTIINEINEIMELPHLRFDDITASTNTFIVMTNLNFDLTSMFERVEVTEGHYQRLKNPITGRLYTTINVAPDCTSRVITMKYKDEVKGFDFKYRDETPRWFRNSLTVVVSIDGRPVNCKVCSNGVLQITGCKDEQYLDKMVRSLLESMTKFDVIMTTVREPLDKYELLLVPAMRNIDFNLGFCVDREKLSQYVNGNTNFRCLPETLLGYTGINVKSEISGSIKDMVVRKLFTPMPSSSDTVLEWNEVMTTYNEYLECLKPEDVRRKMRKKRYNTFLIFGSGKVIASSVDRDFGRQAYNDFIQLMANARDVVEEHVEPPTTSQPYFLRRRV